MKYEKAVDQFDQYMTSGWGTFTTYAEVGEDLFALRQVQVYANGNCLRYDRENWCDEFGSLGGARDSAKYGKLSRKEWHVEDIDRAEFESVWEQSMSAPNQPQRYTTGGREWEYLKLINRDQRT